MNSRGSRMLSLVAVPCAIAVLVGTSPRTARAEEPWLFTATLSGASALNDPYRDAFGLGGSADVGVYRPLAPWLLVGGRLGGMLLAQDHELGQPSDDHGMYTMARLAAVARFRPFALDIRDPRRSTGLWLEAGAGPGFSENSSPNLVLDAAVGYGFDAGAVTLGPAFRYQQVVETGAFFAGHDARLASLGVEVTFGDVARRADDRSSVVAAAADDSDSDGDGIVDAFDRCDGEAETYNGFNDHDGCPDTATVALVGDRVVIDETVFFDFDQSVVSARGRETLAEIHTLCDARRCHLARIEGYADSRGTAAYNRELGARRANAVRDVLIEQGVPAGSLVAVTYGESAPIFVSAHTEAQHALNRRVEFVVTPTVGDVD